MGMFIIIFSLVARNSFRFSDTVIRYREATFCGLPYIAENKYS
jgi:hypothetical protein